MYAASCGCNITVRIENCLTAGQEIVRSPHCISLSTAARHDSSFAARASDD